MSSQVVDQAEPTLTEILTELVAAIKTQGPGTFIFPLPREVSSESAGLLRHEYRRNYKTFVAFYKFGCIDYRHERLSTWKFQFRLACFADGGQTSNVFDALTMLNYCTPTDVRAAFERRAKAL